jgi:hypothetical protein
MKSALIMCFADPAVSPRPRRMLRLLTEMGYGVDLLSYPTEEPVNGRQLALARPSAGGAATLFRRAKAIVHLGLRRIAPGGLRDRLNRVRLGIAGFEAELRKTEYDLIVVEDIHMLSLALRVRGRARVVVDAREFYPRQNDENTWFRISEKPEAERICRLLLPQADVVLTVSPGLVDAYREQFGVHAHLVTSAPWYRDLVPSETIEDRVRMVHAGIANPNRQLEKMVDIAAALDDRFTLDFYLAGSEDYIGALRDRAARSNGRVRVHPPVAFDDIIPTLNRFDIGLYYLEPIGFNLRHSLPNKLFEFIQARLMVAIGPSPDMARVVREHDCGVVADSFDPAAMIGMLSRQTAEDIRRYKRNSDAAARVLCFEEESKKLRRLLAGETAEAPARSA